VSAGIQALATVANALFIGGDRSLGPFMPHVVLEEQHRDDLVITEFPVEKGAAITDHSYKRPATLVLRYGWSNSTARYDRFSRQLYAQLLALQASRQPFSVSTGKRLYRNMLFAALDVTTDKTSENVLIITAALKEIILTSTQTANNPTTAKPAQEAGNQASPESTGSTTDRGTVQASGVGSQAFTGSYNPGDYSGGTGASNFNPRGGATPGSLGLGGAVGEALDGLSAPTYTADVGEMTVQDGTTGEVLAQGEAPPYSPFSHDPNLP
jgi:hypothetical protein